MGGRKSGNSHGSRKHVQAAAAEAPKSDPRKVSVYLPDTIMDELRAEAQRQERSLSWLIQKSWRMARDEIRKLVV
jgi:uncharacterized small protein (TIGR04563 family)